MNILLQCCALIMLFSIIIMFLREKRLALTKGRLFIFAMLSCFVALIFDISSLICIYHAVYGNFSPVITRLVCKLYVMLLVCQGYFGFLYAASSVLYGKKHKSIFMLYLFVFLAGETAMALSPIYYFQEGRSAYSYGLATTFAYGLASFFIVSTISISFVFRSKMTHRRFMALLAWQGIWLIAAAVQLFHPELLVVGFAASFGMVILYAQLENPNEYIDRLTGLFTRNAFTAYIADLFNHDRKFSCLSVRAVYYSSDTDIDLQNNILMRSVEALKNIGDDPVFRIGDESFCIVYSDPEEMERKKKIIENVVEGATDVPAKAAFILIRDSSVFLDQEEFLKFFRIHEDDETDVVEADEKQIEMMRHEKEIRSIIDSALNEDRVEVFFQPFYDVKADSFTSAEALVRIREKDGSLVPPGEFIPVAEKNGQIVPLGISIFEKVCRFLASKKPQSLGLKCIEINMSVAQFDLHNPYHFVTEYMQKYDIKPEWINLEITETASNDVKNIILLNMNKLIEKGVMFSLDDFGTGRSNLDYFVNMPVKNVKFDYKLTQGYFTNEKIRYVVKGMMAIIKNMGLKVVTEGVETKEQLRTFISLGVDYIQGFYFSKPVPETEFLKFLKKNNRIHPEAKGSRTDTDPE